MRDQQSANVLGDWARIAIAKHFRKILKHEPEVLQDKDPEQLHQMRVGMRRLRSAMTGFAPALNLPTTVTAKQIGGVAKTLGKLRDIDVLQQTLIEQYQPPLPPEEQKQLDKVLKKLKKDRKQAFKAVEATLQQKKYARLISELENWLENPSYQPIAAIKIEEVLPDLLLPQVSQLLLHDGWLVGAYINEGIPQTQELSSETIASLLEQDTTLHSLRKEAKRTRYNMELFVQFYGDNYSHYLEKIKAIQEVLGQIQDCFVLAEFLKQVFTEELVTVVPTLTAQLQTTREQKWREWQVLQKQFLDSKTRKELRSILQTPQLSTSPL